MSINHNRIKVADLETNQRDKILKTNENGELEFSDISQQEYDPVSATTTGIVDNTSLQELGGADKTINGVRIGKGNSNNVENTALGNEALLVNTSGTYNTATGSGAVTLNTTGSLNTGIGNTALYNNTTGSYNTGVGTNSLYSNKTGNSNTALGNGALAGNPNQTSPSNTRNTAIGASAGSAIRTGSDNVLIGGDIPIATNSGLINGNKNIEIGRLNNLHQTGDNNVFIGWASSPTSTLSNNIIISDGAGNIAIRKTNTNQLLAPTLTKALVTSGGTTSLVNKEYADSNLPTMTTLNVAPTSATATGVKGDIRIDNDYVYICVNTNTWKRSALTAW
ncbi:MAG: hypothetical protein J7574_20930 [Flavobacterium sp.]|uniref:hypothetical protein n=1 Tax=Flavobacterium sp. TaxID=239 RepID=UPI001B0F1DEC|nr:hypothetical protein [Flavobacterium sp.]MBO9586639.1 hypothetical protein [Flavobacterium sp.]